MAKKIKLPDGLVSRIAEVTSDLEAQIEEWRNYFNERTEKWQESERGMAVDAWLGELEDFLNTLAEFDETKAEPEEV